MKTLTRYILREKFTNIYGGEEFVDVNTYEKESHAFEYFDSLTKHNKDHKLYLVKITEYVLAG